MRYWRHPKWDTQITGIKVTPLDCLSGTLCSEKLPPEFETSLLAVLSKKGDFKLPGIWLGISLMPTFTKLYNRMILHRLKRPINPRLRRNQNGFRDDRCTHQHIICLRNIIDAVEACQDFPLIGIFVTFRKRLTLSLGSQYGWYSKSGQCPKVWLMPFSQLWKATK